MNTILFGEVLEGPDGGNCFMVYFGDATRRCFAHPLRFLAPNPTPVVGDFVAVCPGAPEWAIVWITQRL